MIPGREVVNRDGVQMPRIASWLLGASVLLLAACGTGGDGEAEEAAQAGNGELTEVRVGVLPIVDVAPIYVGIEQGIFEEHGLELNLVSAQGGAAIVPGVVSGEIQVGFSNITSLLLASHEGLPLRIVAPGSSTTGQPGQDYVAVVTNPDSGIETPADLSGHTVAVNTLNNIGDATVSKVVDDDGGNPSAVEFLELGFPDMPAALSSGQVDAAWITEPHLSTAMAQGAVPLSWNYAEVHPELTVAAYFTSEQYMSNDPETVEVFTAAVRESLSYTQQNPQAAINVLSEYTEIDTAMAEQLSMPEFGSEINTATVQLLADLALEYDLVDSQIDISTLLP